MYALWQCPPRKRHRLYSTYGVSEERLVARFNEALSLIQKLWTEEDLTFEGQFWKIKNATLLPRPVQKPHPPIWFGAHVPAALKRAARYGSGFIGAGSSSTQNFKNEVQTVLLALEEAKKDPADFTIGKRVYLAVDTNRERAARRLREFLGLFYRKPDMADNVAVWGSPEECADRHVPAAFWETLIFDIHACGPHGDQPLGYPSGIDGISPSGIGIRHHGDTHGLDNVPGRVENIFHLHQANVGLAQQ